MAHAAARLPSELVRRPMRVLRPQDGETAYAHPRPEFARLTRAGALHRLATGYYAVVPDDRIGQHWLPELEAAATAIAVADEGLDTVTTMGLSAARIHAAIPRAIGIAVIATSRHRRPLTFTDRPATALFIRRNVPELDLERHHSELGAHWVTTIEQTILDLAARPHLGELPAEAHTAIQALLPRADKQLLEELADRQRRRATLRRIQVGRHA